MINKDKKEYTVEGGKHGVEHIDRKDMACVVPPHDDTNKNSWCYQRQKDISAKKDGRCDKLLHYSVSVSYHSCSPYSAFI